MILPREYDNALPADVLCLWMVNNNMQVVVSEEESSDRTAGPERAEPAEIK